MSGTLSILTGIKFQISNRIYCGANGVAVYAKHESK
jgi:hypothetical protein